MAVALEPALAETAVAVRETEADWVAAARRGDKDGLSRLYERYAPVVHGALIARVPPHEARDLVQDVFVIAMRRMDDLRAAESVGGWLLAIARARAADYWRAARPRGELPEAAASDPPRAEVAQVLAALRELPGRLPRGARDATGRRPDRSGDRGADRPHARLGARQPAPRAQAPAREARMGRIER